MRSIPIRLSAFSRILCLLLAGAGLFCATPHRMRAEDAANEPPDLTDEGHEDFPKVGPLVDAKNYDAAIAVLNELISKVGADSFDRFLAEDTLGKIYWQAKSSPTEAQGHFEQAEQIARQHPNYFRERERLEHLQLMAELYYTIGSAMKDDKVGQQRYLDLSSDYLKRWLSQTKSPRGDDEYLYATLLFSKAIVNPDKVDVDLMKQAREATEKALRLEIRPKDTYYHLLAYECQSTGDLEDAADYLELLTTLKPTNKDYWSALVAVYNNIIVGADKDPKKQRIYYARMINAQERAQALGYMNTPRENQNLVSFYNQVGQYGKATELMEKGLRNGAIEDKLDNWIYLAECYEQIGSNQDSIRVLKDAEARYPDIADVDALLSEFYGNNYDTKETYNYAAKAVAKGNLSKRFNYVTYQRLAYAAYELGKYQDALDAVHQALQIPGSPEGELKRFERGILDAIKHEEDIKKAAEAATASH